MVAAAGHVTGYDQFVIIGSQAILGSFDTPPDSLLQSLEVDIYPLVSPGETDREAVDKIDGALGDGSQFHAAYGYYAHGVGPETAKPPRGWEERLVKRVVPPRPGSRRETTAWCLEMHDLVLSKCMAGRNRDWEYATAALEAGLVEIEVLLARTVDLPTGDHPQEQIVRQLRVICGL